MKPGSSRSSEGGAVAEAVRAPDDPFVHAGNSWGRSSTQLGDDLAGLGSIRHRSSTGAPSSGPVRWVANIFGCRTRSTTTAVALVVGVHRVEHVAGVDVAPDDVVGRPLEREEADPALVVVGPPVGEGEPFGQRLGAEHDRKVVDHGEVAVMERSWMDTGPPTGMSTTRRTRPSTPVTVYCTWLPQAQ